MTGICTLIHSYDLELDYLPLYLQVVTGHSFSINCCLHFYSIYLLDNRLLDEGTYTCVASNKAGSDEKSTAIRILTPPTIHDSSDDNDVDVLLNEPTYLNVCYGGKKN